MPIIHYFVNNKFVIFLAITFFASSFIDFPEIFSLNLYFWYLPFYILGCYLSNHSVTYLLLLKKYGLIMLVVFLTWAFLEFLGFISLPKNIVSLFAIFAINFLSSIKIVRNNFLEKVGDNSFFIYLYNTMFIGASSLLFIFYFEEHNFYNNFYCFAPFLMFIGVFSPIILQKHVISRLPLLSKLIR